MTLTDDRLQVTVKKMGSDNWTPVAFSSQTGLSPEDGTDFTHGDQLDVRWVHNGQTHPVSFDGTERTNYFPVTIVVI